MIPATAIRLTDAFAVLAAAAAMLSPGCGRPADPELAVAQVGYHSIPPEGARFPSPRAVAEGPGGELYVLDTAARVLVFDGAGRYQRSWPMPDAEAGNPEGVCVLADGRIAVADTHYHRVVFFDKGGGVLDMLGRFGKEPGEFLYPVSIAQDAAGHVYVAEYGENDRVQKFTAAGDFVLEFGGFGTRPGEFQRLGGIAWRDGRVYCCDVANNRVQTFGDDGRFLDVLIPPAVASGVEYPYDVSIGPSGDLYVVEYGAGRVSRFDLSGRLLGRFGAIGRGEGQFNRPWGLAAMSDGRVIVADTENRRLVELQLE